jgi:hypothetical protein
MVSVEEPVPGLADQAHNLGGNRFSHQTHRRSWTCRRLNGRS